MACSCSDPAKKAAREERRAKQAEARALARQKRDEIQKQKVSK